MIVGVCGLGLIGGSLAKVYAEAGHTVLGYDKESSVVDFAILSEVLKGELTKENISTCDLILVAINPQVAIEYIKEMAPFIGKHPIVADCCGTKRTICRELFEVAKESGIRYYGCHPMAGNHNSGFKYSRSNLFHNASMVIVPPDVNNLDEIDELKAMLAPVGFGKFAVSTAETHDKVISFTSQMPHLISNAYIKSPSARVHKGFSAGSYKDMTRVAWLAPQMWAELFMENKDNLILETDILIKSLTQYKEAMETGDLDRLVELLADGARIKKEIDG